MSVKDRLGVGMLFAGGVGISVGTSIANSFGPVAGWVSSSAVIASGFGYEMYQCRKIEKGGDHQ